METNQRRYLTENNETLVVRFIIVVVAYFFVRSIVRNAAKAATDEAILVGDVNALAAVQIRQAINPSGFGWTMGLDGTNLNKLYEAANSVTDTAKAKQYYNTKFGSDMLLDVQNDTDEEEFKTFIGVLNKTIKPPTTTTTTPNTTTKTKGYYTTAAAQAYEVTLTNGQYSTAFKAVGSAFKAGALVSTTAPVQIIKVSQSGTLYSVFKVKGLIWDSYFMVRKDLIIYKG
ncbi:hypothetical protein [Runella limosa]|uniref:hypothetical protein n=1 Tax=Runella limosa TaxID=370978 RepID=UPI0003F51240|nr:hypothetical protein [Runella limosa]